MQRLFFMLPLSLQMGRYIFNLIAAPTFSHVSFMLGWSLNNTSSPETSACTSQLTLIPGHHANILPTYCTFMCAAFLRSKVNVMNQWEPSLGTGRERLVVMRGSRLKYRYFRHQIFRLQNSFSNQKYWCFWYFSIFVVMYTINRNKVGRNKTIKILSTATTFFFLRLGKLCNA